MADESGIYDFLMRNLNVLVVFVKVTILQAVEVILCGVHYND